jgi:hypothetical protein
MTQGPLGMEVEVLEVAGPKGYPVAEEIGDVVPVMAVGHRPAKWPEEKLSRD